MIDRQQEVKGPRILVVDDNDDNRYTLMLYLTREGYKYCETAQDGEEAIERLKTDRFDLVLLDVMMPKLDGYQVLFWLREQPQLRDLPIIMISALNEVHSVVRCIQLGAVDYLFKPFNSVLLKARLAATLEKKQLRDRIDAHLARLEAEFEAARKLQVNMVPHAFPAPTAECPVDLFAVMEPAREVGGDLYDFFRTADGRLCFLIGDVAGKGMPAALFMARAKSLFRIAIELMRRPDGGPAGLPDVVGRVNRELSENNDDAMFVTMFIAMLTPGTGELEFCNAGHNPPYHLKGGQLAALRKPAGFVLGVHPGAVYPAGVLTLAAGESLFLFTDGVIEATNPASELFGHQRLESILLRSNGRASAELINAVVSEVRDFVGEAQPSDDITMLALRRLRFSDEAIG